MKSLILILLGLFFLAIGCSEKKKSTSIQADSEFQKISDEFISGYLDWRPIYAVSLGFHQYDGKITDLSKKSIEAEIFRLKKYDKLLAEIDSLTLSPQMLYDFCILKYAIKREINKIEDIYAFDKNPLLYANVFDISSYIVFNFAPIDERINSVLNIEKQLPAILAAARLNLKDSLPKPLIQASIQVVKGNADFLKEDVVVAAQDVKNDSLLKRFKAVNEKTIKELKSFAEYLEKEKLPTANNSFALGKEKYKKMLLAEGIQLSPEKILEIGLAEIEKEKAEFDDVAKKIDPYKKSIEVFQDLQKSHPNSNSLIASERRNIELIHQFILDKKIITAPSQENVKTEETPKYARSLGAAMMIMPGAFEKKANEAYFFVTPVDPSWSNKQKEDWLSMFEKYTSTNIAIYEVYPGHYIQALHLQSSAATKIEKIFISESFNEGWAHYTEKMMIEQGFGNDTDPMDAAKFKLIQLNESLLRLCRLCASIKMHCEGMSIDEATKLFMDNWHQGEQPCKSEAMRGITEPVYLFYSLGKWQLLKLRNDYEKQEGTNFSLRKFHDEILDYGEPPFILLREKLLRNKDSWDQIL